MKGFRQALGFMTILPHGEEGGFDAMKMAPWFPVVGLALGFLTALFDLSASKLWPAQAVAVCDVVLLAMLSGAFHLDGLADAADGLFSHRSRERALEIMKDSRVGVMGAVALACCLGVKWAGLSALESHRFLAIMAAPSLSRSSMLFGMRFLSYGRPSGAGEAFFQNPLPARAFWGLSIPVCLCLFMGVQGLAGILCFVLATWGLIRFYKKKMGCITGDMLGAMGELNEALLFLILSGGFQ